MNKEKILNELKKHNENFVIKEVKKTNGVKLLAVTLEREGINPSVYLNNFKSEEEAIEGILKVFSDFEKKPIQTPDLSKEFILNNLFAKMVNDAGNSHLPHLKFTDDLIITFAVKAIDEGWMTVDNKIMKGFNITLEEMEENCKKDYTCRKLSEIISESLGIEIPETTPVQYVISNTENVYGAAGITDEELLNNILEKENVNNLIIIPSSIHEVIVVPQEEITEEDIKKFKKMIKEVNENEVRPEDRLADSPYIYTKKSGVRAA